MRQNCNITETNTADDDENRAMRNTTISDYKYLIWVLHSLKASGHLGDDSLFPKAFQDINIS